MLSRNFSNILVLEGLWLYIGLIKTTMASHCRILRTNVDIVTDHRYQIITDISQKKVQLNQIDINAPKGWDIFGVPGKIASQL